MRGVTVVIVRL